MIYAIGYDDMGRRVSSLHEQDGDIWTIRTMAPGLPTTLMTAPDLGISLLEMRKAGATLIIASPSRYGEEFACQFSHALANQR